MPNFNAYIDEAGDEGFVTPELPDKGSSEWFVLGAVVVPEERDRELSHAVDELRELLNRPAPKPLHFRSLRHGAKRAAMVALSEKDFSVVCVALWKPPNSDGKSFPKAPYMYNWACRLLVERLTWFSAEEGRGVNLYFSNRATTKYADLAKYMVEIQGDASCKIRRNCIQSLKSVNQTVKLVQIADFYVSACFSALEPDSYGHAEEQYLLAVENQLYRRNGNLFSYGFKVYPPAGMNRTRYPWLARL